MSKVKEDKRSPFWLVLSMALFMFSPFTLITTMKDMVGDTAIQIRLGLDSIASGHIILDEIYSWHEGLVFTAHEAGWYLLMGFVYKFLGLAGVILVGALFTYLTAYFCLRIAHSSSANPLVTVLVTALVPFMSGFPDYSVRPSCTSLFALALLIYVYMNGKKHLNACITFVALSFFLGWMHGGILPVFALVMVFFMVVELIYKEYRSALYDLCAIVLGFLVSLLNPIGIRVWTFGLKQSSASDVWQYVDEWQPMEFGIFASTLLLLLLIGFMVSDKVKSFSKPAITKLGLICMFFIGTCVYKRFMLQLSIVYLMFAPEFLTDLIAWVNAKLIHVKSAPSLSSKFYKLLAFICILATVATGALRGTQYIHSNSMADIEAMACYDRGVVDYALSAGYKRPFNTFNTGSWLAFSGVPVHIDNRIDPYMMEYSGVDHVRDKMLVTSLADMDFIEGQYACDAFILEMGDGYSFLLYEIETYAPDRYRVVYDNVVTSPYDGSSMRWVIIEPTF
ncbi:hypothetical protein SAMN06296952_1072 [Oscillospiraceae bacterium]|nr:hypothetical protein SAMN06296952_1072 [Oscillospiraceae bacterium]